MAGQEYFSDLVGEMHHLRMQRELCDVNLCVEGFLIPAHRVVLAALSPYFRAMFCSHLEERHKFTINIKDIKQTTVEAIVDFAYTGKLKLEEETVQSVMQTAAMMQITPVVRICGEFLSGCLHPSNCLGFRDFAKRLGCLELYHAADKFCEENFSEVSKEEEFSKLSVDEVIGLIVRDSLKVTKEEEVYSAVMWWMEFDPERKKEDAVKIMEHVRLPLVEWDFLIKKVSKDKLFVTNEECRNYLQQARAFQASSFHPDLINFALNEAVPRSYPRTSFCTKDTLYILGGETGSREIVSNFESFKLSSKQSTPLSPLPEAKRSIGLVLLDNNLYAIGGATKRQCSNSVHIYSIYDKQWKSRGDLCVARSSLSAVVVQGEIMVFGGHGEGGALSSVEKYDEELNTWSLNRDMLEARSMSGAAVIGDFVYLCGGYNGLIDLMSCHKLNKKSNQWSACGNLLEARSMHGVVALEDKLFVAGGISRDRCLSSMESYSPQTDQWTAVTAMPVCLRGVGLSVVGKAIYALGGHNGESFQSSIMKYDCSTGDWVDIGSLLTNRGRFGLAS